MTSIPAAAILRSLMRRERQCAYLLISGATTNQSIADRMGIKEYTVKAYMKRLFDRMGADDRTELALFLVRYPEMEERLKREFEEPIGKEKAIDAGRPSL